MGPSEKSASVKSYQGRSTRVFGVALCFLALVTIAISFWWRDKCESDLREVQEISNARIEGTHADNWRKTRGRFYNKDHYVAVRNLEAAKKKSENASLFFRLGLSAGGVLFVLGAMLFVLPVYLWNRQFRPEKVRPKKRRPAFERYKKHPKFQSEDLQSTSKCPNCGRENSVNAQVCPRCEQQLTR